MDKQTRFLIAAQTLLLVTALILLLTRPTSNPTATYQRDTIRYVIIREIYAVDKKHDSLYNSFRDSLSSPNTTQIYPLNSQTVRFGK
jgi:hypothetical protein